MFVLPTRRRITFGSNVNIVCDGNSLTYGIGGTAYPSQLAGKSPLTGGETITNVGVNGQTTADMTSTHSDVDAAWDAGKTNILVAWEGTNSIANIGRTAAQAKSDLEAYITAVSAVHPWIVIIGTTISCQTHDGESQTIALNAVIDDYNTLLRANYRAMGATALFEVRYPGNPFTPADYTNASFETMATTTGVWADGETGGHVHLNTAGYLIIANLVAATLRRVSP